jgi:hypothetical protein
VCALDLKEEELLELREGVARIFIDERLKSSAELAVVATARLAYRSVHRDKDWPQGDCPLLPAQPQRPRRSSSSFVDLRVL